MVNRTALTRSRAFYFCYYAAGAALLPFLAVYFENLGLNGRQIGLLSGILPSAGIVAAPLWSAAADLSHRYKLILSMVVSGAVGMALVISQVRLFEYLIPVVILYAVFSTAIMPLTDHAVMGLLVGRKELYGRQRIWGAVGWGLAAPLVGYLIEIGGMQWSFRAYAGIMFVGLLIVQKITFQTSRARRSYWSEARKLFSNRPWMLFLFLVFLGGAGMTVIHTFLFLYLNELGASKTLMGFALTAATLSELPVFFFTDRILARWTARNIFVFGVLVLVVRVIVLSIFRLPWVALLTQLLHGLTFSLMWVAAVSYADEIGGEASGATAQGLLGAVFMGVASAAGAIAGGVLYEDFGGALMFRITGLGMLAGVILYLAAALRFHQGERGDAGRGSGG